MKKDKATGSQPLTANNQQEITDDGLFEREEDIYEFSKGKPKIEVNQQQKMILIDLSKEKPKTGSHHKKNKSYELSIAYAK